MVEQVKIHGLDGVRKALRALPKDLRKKELDKAIRPAANLIRDAARQLAPRGKLSFHREASKKNSKGKSKRKAWDHKAGDLKEAIIVRTEKKKFLNDAARLRIGVLHDRNDPNVGAWYWRFVEFGTSRRMARPFLVPAFEMMKYIADAEIKKRLLLGVERQAKIQRSKYAQVKGR